MQRSDEAKKHSGESITLQAQGSSVLTMVSRPIAEGILRRVDTALTSVDLNAFYALAFASFLVRRVGH